MNVESLMKVLEKVPDDYEIFFKIDNIEMSLKDVVEVDIAHGKLFLK